MVKLRHCSNILNWWPKMSLLRLYELKRFFTSLSGEGKVIYVGLRFTPQSQSGVHSDLFGFIYGNLSYHVKMYWVFQKPLVSLAWHSWHFFSALLFSPNSFVRLKRTFFWFCASLWSKLSNSCKHSYRWVTASSFTKQRAAVSSTDDRKRRTRQSKRETKWEREREREERWRIKKRENTNIDL